MGLTKTDEVTYVVTMNVNGKSEEQVDTFSEFYQKLVDGNESTTFGWQFFRGTDAKIYLIERYKNAYDLQLKELVSLHQNKIKSRSTFEDGYEALKLANAAYNSLRLKKTVKIQ